MRTNYTIKTAEQIAKEQKSKKYNFDRPTTGKVKPQTHKVVKPVYLTPVTDDCNQWDFKSVE